MFLMALGLVEQNGEELLTTVTNQTSSPEETLKISTNKNGDNTMDSSTPIAVLWTFLSNQLANLLAGQCQAAYSFTHWYYHIGCAFFLLAFLAPSYRYNAAALYMRCMFVFGCILFIMWSYLTECRPDVLIWSGIFIFVNLIHMALLICKLRPVKFEKDIESVSKNKKKKLVTL